MFTNSSTCSLIPLNPAQAREKMRIKDGKLLHGEIRLEHGLVDRLGEDNPVPGTDQ